MNIYVGNLSYDVLEADLVELFEKFGEVSSVNMIKDKFSGKPKGFAFVDMARQNEAERAIKELNETEFKGISIRVSIARPRNSNASRRFRRY